MTDKLTAEHARELFEYNESTGNLVNRKRQVKDDRVKEWNTRYAGNIAGTLNVHGYIKITIFGYEYLAHRIIWLMKTGEFPEYEIDHKNGDLADNRWPNLRPANPLSWVV